MMFQIHCEMVTATKLINAPVTSQLPCVCVLRSLKINSRRRFQVYNTVVLAIVTMRKLPLQNLIQSSMIEIFYSLKFL